MGNILSWDLYLHYLIQGERGAGHTDFAAFIEEVAEALKAVKIAPPVRTWYGDSEYNYNGELYILWKKDEVKLELELNLEEDEIHAFYINGDDYEGGVSKRSDGLPWLFLTRANAMGLLRESRYDS